MNRPVYTSWHDVPNGLHTKTQLREMRLKPAKGQKPVAFKHGYERWGLYDKSDAIPLRECSPAQLAALAEARRIAAMETCERCGKKIDTALGEHWPMHNDCWAAERAEEEASEKERLAQSRQWAMTALQDDRAVILDTETTGLDDAEIIELAIINMQGETLFNQRLKSIRAIEVAAQHVHGISAEMLMNEPTFGEIYNDLAHILTSASTVYIYNEDFDTGVLANTARIHGFPPIKFQGDCVMLAYAFWHGEWSDYFGDWKWQRLYGGDHTALGDCLATLAAIKRMFET